MKYFNIRSSRFFHIRGAIAFLLTLTILHVFLFEVLSALKDSAKQTLETYNTSLQLANTAIGISESKLEEAAQSQD